MRNASSTMIAADVRSTNARSGLSAHRKICTGNAVEGSSGPPGTSTMNATMPIISSGADSPSAWAMPMIVPVNMPGIASGRTWWVIVCIFDAPIPSAASRIDGGTDFRAARLAMMMVGRVIRVRTSPPTRGAERGRPKKSMNTARPSRPKMMEGTAARLLMLTSMRSVSRLVGANSSRYTAAATPMGKDRARVTSRVRNEPTAAPRIPASSGSRESPAVKNVVLKRFPMRPARSSRSIQAIRSSLTRRSASGALRSMWPLTSMSTSSSAGTRRRCVRPTSPGSASRRSRRMKLAPELTMPYSVRLALRPVTSGNMSRIAFLTSPG